MCTSPMQPLRLATGPAPFRVRVFDALPGVAATWRDVAARATHPAFLDFDWVQTWHQAAGGALSPRVAVIEDETGTAQLLLPLALHRTGPLTGLGWLAGALADYQGPLVADAAPPAWMTRAGFSRIWSAVRTAIGPVDHVALDRLLPSAAGHPNPLLALPHQRFPSAAHAATLRGDWPALYRSRCGRRTRAGHRQKARKLEKLGAVRIERVGPGQATADALEALFRLKSAGWQALGVPDLFADPSQRDFIRRLTARRPDLVHLSRLRVGPRTVAVHWGVVHQGRFSMLLPAYERAPEIARTSPGEQLLLWLLEWASGAGLHTFDFTLGDEAFKARWADRHTPVYAAFEAHSLPGRVYVEGRALASGVKGRIKATPELHARALGLRARLLGRAS